MVRTLQKIAINTDVDPYQLKRFLNAQDNCYETVLNELLNGQKRSHWMWYIFPQYIGLGRSATAVYYAINSLAEAEAYLNHPVLGSRLSACTQTVLALTEKSANDIFGYPDDLKFKSSMTLFAEISAPNSLFERALAQFFDGSKDDLTLAKLKQ